MRLGTRVLERGDYAAVRPTHDAETRVVARMLGGDLRGRVHGAVVDDDYLEVFERLRRERLERLCQVGLFVTHGKQDRNQRAIHGARIYPSFTAFLDHS